MTDIINHYNTYDEDSRLTTTNSSRIEFLTNIKFLNKYINKKAKILDVGAGTGLYSFYYADKEYEVSALDLIPKHVEEMKMKKNLLKENISIELGNALDLSRFNDNTFEVVICFGPYYHLRKNMDRDTCIDECLRVLKPNGILAIAYINKFHIVPRMMGIEKKILKNKLIKDLLSNGNIEASDSFLSISHFCAPEEIEFKLKKLNIEVVSHIASEGISPFIKEKINDLSNDDFKQWLKYHFETCEEKSTLGISNHGMIIVKKK